MTAVALATSRLAMGSSARDQLGCLRQILAIATRCRSPPESGGRVNGGATGQAWEPDVHYSTESGEVSGGA